MHTGPNVSRDLILFWCLAGGGIALNTTLLAICSRDEPQDPMHIADSEATAGHEPEGDACYVRLDGKRSRAG